MMGEDFAAAHWYRTTALSLCLVPLSLAYGAVVALRGWGYASGALYSTRLPVPVIVIGNLVAGGTGKTPLVLWTAALLRRHGYRPGIVLRGYGGGSTAAREVRADDQAAVAGD